ncbi:hypothetical protein CKA32_002048 [Geitlerinema sp. FC II]|nr:hypothetical protein CKA32_002048 [Geitlerinema sp. FC II]
MFSRLPLEISNSKLLEKNLGIFKTPRLGAIAYFKSVRSIEQVRSLTSHVAGF